MYKKTKEYNLNEWQSALYEMWKKEKDNKEKIEKKLPKNVKGKISKGFG